MNLFLYLERSDCQRVSTQRVSVPKNGKNIFIILLQNKKELEKRGIGSPKKKHTNKTVV